jgi:hypothetical protein
MPTPFAAASGSGRNLERSSLTWFGKWLNSPHATGGFQSERVAHFSIVSNKRLTGLVLLVLLGNLVAGRSAVTAPGRTVLHGHVPKIVGRLTPLGRLGGTTNLHLAIGLPLRNTAALDEFIRELYDPRSPNFRKFISSAEFTARFGPTEKDYDAVKKFAQANGFTVTAAYGNRLLLDVTAPAAAAEKAFNVTLRTYRHPTENRIFFSPDTEPSVDTNLPIVDVSGLSDYPRPYSKIQKLDKAAGSSPRIGSAPDGSSYFGNDFRNAYVPGAPQTGAGQMVGLLEFDGFYSNDIANYAATAGGGRTSIVIQTNLLDHFNGTATNGGNDEVSLDIEMAMALAPGLAKIIVYEGNPYSPNFIPNDVLNAMATNSAVKNLSSSWGWSGGPSASTDNIFTNMAAEGQSFFDASGDSDAFPPGTADSIAPASSPIITQVGGTTLTMNGTGASYASETVWNRGGSVGTCGGISTYYAIPAWQTGINSFLTNGGSTTARNIPDVALTAENCFVYFGNGSSGAYGGTSCAAPLWAAFMALVNQQAAAGGKTNGLGLINPAVYEIANESIYNSAFNDITTGNNTSSSSPNAFYAVPGYDLCTGLGSPTGTNLINALLKPDSLIVISNGGFNAVASAAGTFNLTAQTFFLTNAGSAPLTWLLTNNPSWLHISTNGGTLAVGGSSSVVVSLNTVASNLTAGIYPASLWFSNVTSSVGHSRFFTLLVNDPLVILPTNYFSFAGPSGGPFAPSPQSIILTNERSGTLNWSLNNTSAWFNVSPASGSLSSGGYASVSITTATAAASLANGIYTAMLLFTNTTSQTVQPVTASLLIGQPALQNGGFETGSFSSWTLTGTGGNINFVGTSSSVSGISPHSGTYYAALGEAGSLAYLSQNVTTAPGQLYLLSVWLNSSPNPYSGNQTTPNEFSVAWNGNTLFDKVNLGNVGWTNIQFVVTATNNSTLLKFGERDDPYYLGLDDVTVTQVFAPSISMQPTNLTVLSGSNAVFSVTANGSTPLKFQWQENGTNLANGGNISGATTNALTLTGVTTNNNGNYSVIATNVYGATTSSVATLTVVLPPAIVTAPASQTVECGSNNVTFTASASGTPPLNFQWSLDGTPVSGATNTSFSLTNVHLPTHTITFSVTNLYGNATTNALLTVHDTTAPLITLNGSNPFFVELGAAFVDPGATANDSCAGSVSVTVSGTLNTNAVGTNTLTYSANDGNGNTNSATRTVIVRDTTPPTILWSFTNLILAANTNCSAAMPDVTGTNFIIATDLSGTLTISQTPTNGFILSLGTNSVVITVADASGNVAFSTNTIVVQDQTPPVILSQPQNQTNIIGATANFSVGVSACTPLALQWYFNTNALNVQTNTMLSLSNLDLSLAGNYSVIATAAGGSTTSSVAVLTVDLISPSISITSSANPSGFNDSINFTGGMTPTNASGTIQFLTNSFAFDTETVSAGRATSTNLNSLPRGTNFVTAIYSGDTNDFPATNTLAQIVTNHPPTATAFFTNRFAGLNLKIPVTELASNWNDIDGDTVSLAAIGVSTNGVNVTNNAGTLVYCNSNNVADLFTCTVADGWGGTNFQDVNISIVPLPTNAIPGIAGISQDSSGNLFLNLVGAPDFTYVLETTSNLLSPGIWLPVATNVLGTNGVWQFSDTVTNNPQQFYRLKLAP